MNRLQSILQNRSPLKQPERVIVEQVKSILEEAVKPIEPQKIRKEKPKFMKVSSYLTKETFYKWKAQALKEERKDLQVLEDAVKFYIEEKNKSK